jgi:hypothetical protein
MNLTEFIVNPLTNRPIRKGGIKYYNLLKQGVDLFDNSLEKFKNDKIVCEINGKTEEQIDEIKKNFNENNEEYCCVKGRGVLRKYLVKKRKKMTYENFGNQLAQKSSKKIVEYLHNYDNEDIDLSVEIAKIIDKEAQILSKKYQHCSKFFLLKDNFSQENIIN